MPPPRTRVAARAEAREGGGRYPRRSAVAAGEGQEPGVTTEVGQLGQLLRVVVLRHLVGEVAPAQVEEESLDEEIDELHEDAVLQLRIATHELEGAQDVVLLLPDALQHPIVCVHADWFTTERGISSPDLAGGRLATIGPSPAPGGPMAVSAYILIQTEVGKAAQVAQEVDGIDGVVSAEDVTGPYDVIARAEATTVDELGKMVVSRVQMIDGITRTLTCPVVHL